MPELIQCNFAKHGIDVSRETQAKFERYAELLMKWQKAINLISDATLEEMPIRHFLDSAQLIKYIPDKNVRTADLGSGAGFPGMVLAMLGMTDMHLVESDVRKATFLREVSRETKTPVTIHDDRVEDVNIPNIDLITARALAPLKELLGMAQKLTTPGHPVSCLFMKGEKTEEELAKAQKCWNFSLQTHQSMTDHTGKILFINGLIDKNK